MLTLNDGRKELYQWDTGRTATVDIECEVVHFSNLKYGESLAVEVKESEVAIPNKLLMSGEPIYCWAFSKDENGAYTKKEQAIDVIKRAKPSDYVYTETEVIAVKTAVENALKEAKESGEFKGEKGDKGDRGEQGIQGEKGDKGDKGEPAVTDQSYNPESENAQSGIAVAEALQELCKEYELIDSITLSEDARISIDLPYLCKKVLIYAYDGKFAKETKFGYFYVNGSSSYPCPIAGIPSSFTGNKTWSMEIVTDGLFITATNTQSENAYNVGSVQSLRYIFNNRISKITSTFSFLAGTKLSIYGVKV